MAPIGFFYLSTGLVAPYPDLFGAYALFAGFVTFFVPGFLAVVLRPVRSSGPITSPRKP